MYKTNIKTINALLILILILSAFAPVSYSKNERPVTKRINVKKQADLTITCPAEVVYKIQEIPDWNAGLSGLKRIPFENASADGKNLYCNYEFRGESSILIRPAPQGYVCSIVNTVTRNRQIVCKRNIPPIKTKPKTK